METQFTINTNFKFFKINEDCRDNFQPCKHDELSDFTATALRWLGDMIRPDSSEWCWDGSKYCWTDKVTSEWCSVYLTNNGIAMCECGTSLYRLIF